MKVKFILSLLFLLALGLSAVPQVVQRNRGESTAVGTYNKGSLVNGYLLPRQGSNFRCYSWFSYYILGREYVHAQVYHTVLGAYEVLATKAPSRTYVYMETGRRKGGRPYPHRTHQNGLSVDFMCPLVTSTGAPKYYQALGLFRYLLNFNKQGKAKLNHEVSIDFEALAAHILVLEQQARKNKLRISKVIFNIDLKEELFATPSGRKLQHAGIYFAQQLTPILNQAHDEHYHVDFALLK